MTILKWFARFATRLRRRVWYASIAIPVLVSVIVSVILIARQTHGKEPELKFTATANWERVFTVGEVVSLGLANFAGDITTNTGRPSTVTITATERSRGATAGEAARSLGRIAIDAAQEGDTISVVSHLTGGQRSGSAANTAVDLKVTTPPDAAIDIELGDGSIMVVGPRHGLHIAGGNVNVTVFNVRESVTMRVERGTIRVTDSSGSCRLEARQGWIYAERLECSELSTLAGSSVTLKDTKVAGAATIRSGNGGVRVERLRARTLETEAAGGRSELIDSTVEENAKVHTEHGVALADRLKAAVIQFDTNNAGIYLQDVEGGLKLQSKEGKIEIYHAMAGSAEITTTTGGVLFSGRLQDGAQGTIRSQSGDVVVYVDKDSSCVLDASTRRGRVTVQLPFATRITATEKTWHGAVNQGTASLMIATETGNIDLSSGEPL